MAPSSCSWLARNKGLNDSMHCGTLRQACTHHCLMYNMIHTYGNALGRQVQDLQMAVSSLGMEEAPAHLRGLQNWQLLPCWTP
jgi:hypothetical protein